MTLARRDLRAPDGRTAAMVVGSLCLIGLSLPLLLPGRSYVRFMLHDVFNFMDGIYRISQGQVPHLDFQTPLGALHYLIPTAGWWLAGSYGMAMPVASTLMGLAVLVAACLVLPPRLSVGQTALLIGFLLFLTLVPVNLGEDPRLVSYAMFYNRWAWSALILLYCLYLPRRDGTSWDTQAALAAGAILVFLYYLKMTYLAFGVAFLGVWALRDVHGRRQAQLALVVLFASVLVVEVLRPGYQGAYWTDLIMTLGGRGAVQSDAKEMVRVLGLNAGELALAAGSLLLLRSVERVTPSDVLFSLLVIVASILIIDQNAQERGLALLVVLPVWVTEVVKRSKQPFPPAPRGSTTSPPGRERSHGAFLAGVGLTVLFVLTPVAERSLALAYHVHGVLSTPAAPATSTALDGFLVPKEDGGRAEIEVLASGALDIDGINRARSIPRLQPLSPSEYLLTVADGVALLEGEGEDDLGVIVLDFVNPFNFVTERPVRRGDRQFLLFGDTFTDEVHPAFHELFDGVLIMVPTFPMVYETQNKLIEIYGRQIGMRYEERARSDYWALLAPTRRDLR